VALIAEKRAGGGMRRGQAAPLREVGQHTDGEPIRLYAGRFGPYLKHGSVNANIPKGADPASISLEQAIEIVDARALAAPAKGKGRKKPSAKKPTGDKKSPTKKTSAKADAAKDEKPAAKKAPAKKAAPRTKTATKAAPKTAKSKKAKAPVEEA
jgi:DNA topoisomerase-1